MIIETVLMRIKYEHDFKFLPWLTFFWHKNSCFVQVWMRYKKVFSDQQMEEPLFSSSLSPGWRGARNHRQLGWGVCCKVSPWPDFNSMRGEPVQLITHHGQSPGQLVRNRTTSRPSSNSQEALVKATSVYTRLRPT